MTDEHRCRLLIVDDDPFISDLLTRKFSDAGFETHHAGNGEEAMKRLEEGLDPHTILLDLMMPVMDGYEVLRRVRQNPRLSKIPIIVLSNAGSEADVAKAKELGAAECLIKIDAPLNEVVGKIRARCLQTK